MSSPAKPAPSLPAGASESSCAGVTAGATAAGRMLSLAASVLRGGDRDRRRILLGEGPLCKAGLTGPLASVSVGRRLVLSGIECATKLRPSCGRRPATAAPCWILFGERARLTSATCVCPEPPAPPPPPPLPPSGALPW